MNWNNPCEKRIQGFLKSDYSECALNEMVSRINYDLPRKFFSDISFEVLFKKGDFKKALKSFTVFRLAQYIPIKIFVFKIMIDDLAVLFKIKYS